MPTGLVAFVSALLGSTITAVAWPRRKGRSGSISLFSSTTVESSTTCVDRFANVRLSLLVLFSPPARSKENFTACALKGSPFWNFTPLRSLKVYVFRSGETSQLSASSGVTLPSALILVSVSRML